MVILIIETLEMLHKEFLIFFLLDIGINTFLKYLFL